MAQNRRRGWQNFKKKTGEVLEETVFVLEILSPLGADFEGNKWKHDLDRLCSMLCFGNSQCLKICEAAPILNSSIFNFKSEMEQIKQWLHPFTQQLQQDLITKRLRMELDKGFTYGWARSVIIHDLILI